MRALFADSSYFIAVVSARDAFHDAALRWSRTDAGPVVTTEFVLLEVANKLSAGPARSAFTGLLLDLQTPPEVLVLPASTDLCREGVALFLDRPDKEWSLTDCISFVVMKRRGLTEALTADHHFDQAGFKALLR
jgi:predicted nucleic acid-binding protein